MRGRWHTRGEHPQGPQGRWVWGVGSTWVLEDTLLLGGRDPPTPTLSLRAPGPGLPVCPWLPPAFLLGLGGPCPWDLPPSRGRADLVHRLSALPAQKVKPRLPGAWAKVRVPSPHPSVQGALFPECVPKQDVLPGPALPTPSSAGSAHGPGLPAGSVLTPHRTDRLPTSQTRTRSDISWTSEPCLASEASPA